MSRLTLPEQKYSAESMQRVAMMRTSVLNAGSAGSWRAGQRGERARRAGTRGAYQAFVKRSGEGA